MVEIMWKSDLNLWLMEILRILLLKDFEDI